MSKYFCCKQAPGYENLCKVPPGKKVVRVCREENHLVVESRAKLRREIYPVSVRLGLIYYYLKNGNFIGMRVKPSNSHEEWLAEYIMATANVSIKKVIVYPEGNGTVVTSAHKFNPQGAWNLTAKQMRRLAESAGCSVNALKICKGTLVIVGNNVKAGEDWTTVDRKTGAVVASGKYKLDHFRVDDLSVEISAADKMNLLIADSVAQTLAGPASREVVAIDTNDGDEDAPAPIKTPEEIQAEQDAEALKNAGAGAQA